MKSLIIIGPSGVGKGTIVNCLLSKYPNRFKFVKSFTTRPKRHQETDGVHYYFVSKDVFQSKKCEMLEIKTVFKNSYGTSMKSYESILASGHIPLLDVDVEGMLDIKARLKQLSKQSAIKHDPQTLCILPPSWAVLQQRLRGRGTESEDVVASRMAENKLQINRMLSLKGSGIHFVTNYQYQLTFYGIQIFLKKNFPQFDMQDRQAGKS